MLKSFLGFLSVYNKSIYLYGLQTLLCTKAWKMSQLLECLQCKHENWTLISSTYTKFGQDRTGLWHQHSRNGHRRTLEACWTGTISNIWASCSVKKIVSKKKKVKWDYNKLWFLDITNVHTTHAHTKRSWCLREWHDWSGTK